MAQKNRLKLDFSLPTTEERTLFIQNYILNPDFQNRPLTAEETETIANYILWGKDSEGKNGVQKKEFNIETKHKTWQKDSKEESLDALLETPTFNENMIAKPTQARTKIKRQVFSREEALKKAPPHIRDEYVCLFREIDELELLLNFYDLAHNKRKNPPRSELLERFNPEEKEKINARAQKLSQFHYLKLRHHLVELRTYQYTLKDSYVNPHISNPTALGAPINISDTEPVFDADIPVYPLGVKYKKNLHEKIFAPLDELKPLNFSDEDLRHIAKLIWRPEIDQDKLHFDFRNLEHIYNVCGEYHSLRDAADRNLQDSTLKEFLDTFDYYLEIAELTEVQREIINLKIKGASNQNIAEYINSKYNKSYTINYISTIFRQKALRAVVDAVLYHERIISNLCFPEEFKECNTCHRILLKDSYNFVRKSRSKDGFTNRCKKCDKADRERKKS